MKHLFSRNGLRRANESRPAVMFTFVQLMGLCALAIVAAAMVFIGKEVAASLRDVPQELWWDPLLVLVLSAGVGGCLLWLLTEFILVCGRVRKETAFTQKNVRALGRISLAFAVIGVLLLPLGKPLMDSLLLGLRGVRSPVWWLLPSFAAWAAALMIRAIQVLMRRAVDMQDEQDLTI